MRALQSKKTSERIELRSDAMRPQKDISNKLGYSGIRGRTTIFDEVILGEVEGYDKGLISDRLRKLRLHIFT